EPTSVAKHEVTPSPAAHPIPLPPSPPAPVAKPTPPPAPVAPVKEEVALPTGTKLTLQEGTLNYKLPKFLPANADTNVPRTFVFDNLNFNFATTELTAESEQTVKDLIVIMIAYPSTEVRLEGHTDSVGDAEANKKLSQDRADVVKTTMVANGIDT